MIDRTLLPEVHRILDDWGKMVFLSGPRQVGKTTLAKSLMKRAAGSSTYFNWDVLTDRKKLAHDPYFFAHEPRADRAPSLLVFDEIHKYRKWKSYLKGAWDAYHQDFQFLITGSGRLDLFRKGGDSLLGRYVNLPLLPLTLGELQKQPVDWSRFLEQVDDPPPIEDVTSKLFRRLFRFGGFPEPFVKESDEFHRVWSGTRTELLVREDIRDATEIRNLGQLEQLVHLLDSRVARGLSINSLREDLEVAHETVRDWINVLARFFYLFLLTPYTKSLARSLRKEQKLYLYDWASVEDDGRRLENLVALHLLKAVRTWSALGQVRAELHFLRDKEQREVDFLIVANRKPMVLVECKWSDEELSPHLLYYQNRLEVPHAVQVVGETKREGRTRIGGRTQWLMSAARWLSLLP